MLVNQCISAFCSQKIRALVTSAIIFLILSALLYYTVSNVNPHCDIDSKAYIQRGTFFADSNKFVGLHEREQPYYALGYALFVGMAYKLFGRSLGVIILLQVLVALLSCLLMMRIARRMFGQRAAMVAGALFSVNLGYLVFAQFILTEIVLSFFLLLFFERLTDFWTNPERKLSSLVFSALALGCSIIVKPAALYFVFPVCGLLVMDRFFQGMPIFCARFLRDALRAPQDEHKFKNAQIINANYISKGLAHAFLFAFFFYIPVLGYMTYNYTAFGNFCVSRLDTVNIYYWFFPNVLALQNGTNSDIERNKLLKLSDGSHNFDVVAPLLWSNVKQNPFSFIRVWLTNVFKTFVGLYTTNLKVLVEPQVHGGAISFFKMDGGLWSKAWSYISAGTTQQWVIVVGVYEALWSIIRYVLCLYALFILLSRHQYHWLLLCCAFIGYFSLITGHDGCARFRMMFEFVLIILAAGGIDLLVRRRRISKS